MPTINLSYDHDFPYLSFMYTHTPAIHNKQELDSQPSLRTCLKGRFLCVFAPAMEMTLLRTSLLFPALGAFRGRRAGDERLGGEAAASRRRAMKAI